MSYTLQEWRDIGKLLTDTLLDGENAVVIYLAGVAPTPDCELPSVTVGIRAMVERSEEEFTGNATDFDNACRIARYKLYARRKAIADERETSKAKGVSA
jgi:hypothetical protein